MHVQRARAVQGRAEGGGQERTDDIGQDRGQRTEDRGQRAEDRGQRAKGRSCRAV